MYFIEMARWIQDKFMSPSDFAMFYLAFSRGWSERLRVLCISYSCCTDYGRTSKMWEVAIQEIQTTGFVSSLTQ